MTVKAEVLKAISAAPRCQFPEEIQASLPHMKLATIRSACFDLLYDPSSGVKAARKDRPDAPIASVFYCRPDQIAGVEGLLPYEKIERKPRAGAKVASPDMLLTLPIEGDNKVSSVTVTVDCARKLYAQLGALFGGG